MLSVLPPIYFLIISLAPLFAMPLFFCTARRDFNKKWEHLKQKKKSMDQDLLNCPKTEGKGECNVEDRIHGYVAFVRTDYTEMLKDENKVFPNKKEKWRGDDDGPDCCGWECVASDEYLGMIKQAMETCLKHSPDEEMLKIYYSAYVEKAAYFNGDWIKAPIAYLVATYEKPSIDYRMPESPEEFWKRAQHERIFGFYGYVKASEAASALMMKRGLFKEKKPEEKKPLSGTGEKKIEGEKNLTTNGSKMVSLEKVAKEGSAEKHGKDGKNGEKSKENDDKNMDKKENSAENVKGEVTKMKKSAKTDVAEADKKKDSKEINDGSDKKEEGSKNGSNKKSASKKDKEA